MKLTAHIHIVSGSKMFAALEFYLLPSLRDVEAQIRRYLNLLNFIQAQRS
jgi:hypothetical protein